MTLDSFHNSSRQWFLKNLGTPTPAQQQAWGPIRDCKHTLIAAPTGSGKTLSAFFVAIDQMICQSLDGPLPDATQVVYVSPLKALSNDIQRNLQLPLAGIEDELNALGLKVPAIRVGVRTGDTTVKERQQMLKCPPHILVTTPESLYLLLTSNSGRDMLRFVKTLIVDEIHALIDDKRGSHLSLSIERLEALTGGRLQRIGLSATQKPIDLVARFLVGSRNIHNDQVDCTVIDVGHRRTLDLSLEVPKSPLTAVMSNEVWTEIYDRLVELIQSHKTTLIFVNTRRLAERLAIALSDRIGEEHITSHHGSMSKEHRLKAEQMLKAGKLKALVATASMELGIDIGAVNLVVQISSPKRIATFLQRVGRSGHFVGGTPKGILFPLTRDDVVESIALYDAIRRGELDHILMPEGPLDILAQQIVAEVAAQEWTVSDLYTLFHHAYPYRNLTLKKFQEIVRMLADGFTTRRGRRSAYLHYDAIHGTLRPRRGSRLVALTNGGAIPDTFDYEVVLQPEGITVGSLNEEYALETLAGDIFSLGTHSWQLIRVEGLKVIVHDAAGQPPSVPFWQGEGPERSQELSESVSRLREHISQLLDEDPLPRTLESGAPECSLAQNKAVRWLVDEVKICAFAAEQAVLYLWMGKTGLGVMPTRQRIVMERFFDEAGDMHVVVHSPYGSRINRGWGLALRKKFCRNFNFELQAAVNENSIILSLSSTHSFSLDEVFRYLNTNVVRETLIQAMLDAPLFEIRWRWNATRAFAVIRNRGGQRVPPQLQRMQSEDLIAQVFPDQIACAENIQGDRQIPGHPLVEQVIHDCLTEAMDIEALEELIGQIQHQQLELVAKDLREPSVFAQEIINARPYAFLDDTEFAERRVNAIRNRSWLDPAEANDLSQLDAEAIARVKEEAWPQVDSTDELHDVLTVHGFVTESEGQRSGWGPYFEILVQQGRATRLQVQEHQVLWVASERIPLFDMLYPKASWLPVVHLPEWITQRVCGPEEALREIVRGRLEALGPVALSEIETSTGLPRGDVEVALIGLQTEGFAFRGAYTPKRATEEWCERRLLQRIHKYTIESLRQSIQPVSVAEFMRFLFAHHHLSSQDGPSGPQALEKLMHQLEGYESPAASWEADLIPSRMSDYDPVWLDVLCMSGKIVWGRFHPPKRSPEGRRMGPVKNTPIAFLPRLSVPIWRQTIGVSTDVPHLSVNTKAVLDNLQSSGACFFDDLVVKTHLLKSQVEAAIAELVSWGMLINDSYAGMRALLTPEYNKPSAITHNRVQQHRRAFFGIEHAGRWSLMPRYEASLESLEYNTLEYLAHVYLRRWGVVFRSLIMEKESFAPPWRVLVRVFRRMELRGEVRGGRFVSHVSGEQFALAETVDQLRLFRNQAPTEELVSISAVDPLNLLGIILPGRRVPNITSNRIVFRDGVPLAVLESGEIQDLKELVPSEQWDVHKILIQRKFPPKLRYYLGKNYV